MYHNHLLLSAILFFPLLFQIHAQTLGTPSLNPEQTVSPTTGRMSFTLPITSVKDLTSHSFPIELTYRAGIKTDQQASMVGLGFDIQPGIISRRVVMVADDETAASFSKMQMQEVSWIKVIYYLFFCPPMLATNNIYKNQAHSNYIGGLHFPGYNMTKCQAGFLVNDDGKKYDLPDVYTINTPFLSGDMMYNHIDEDGNVVFIMKSSTSTKAVKILFKNNTFKVTLADGTRLYFDRVTKTRTDNRMEAFFGDGGSDGSTNGVDYWTKNFSTAFTTDSWYLTKVLYNDFVGSETVPQTGPCGAWVLIDYTEAKRAGSFFQFISPYYQLNDRWVSRSTIDYENFLYVKEIRTANQKAQFNYVYDRLDNPVKCPFASNPQTYYLHPRLDNIKLYTREGTELQKIDFVTDYTLRGNTTIAIDNSLSSGLSQYYIPNGTGDVSSLTSIARLNSNKGSLTLKKVVFNPVQTDATLPDAQEIQFNYANNYALNVMMGRCTAGYQGTEHHKEYSIELRDVWGYYNTAALSHNVNDFNVSGLSTHTTKSDAWSLTGVSFPNGGKINWEYEPNCYDSSNNVVLGSNAVKFGGGIRVKTINVYDGINPSKPIRYNYFYTNGSTPGNFEETATSTTTSGHATLEPFSHTTVTMPSNDPRNITSRGGFYASPNILYERVTVAKNCDFATHTAPDGYVVYGNITSRDFPNTGRFGDYDMSWKRGMVQTVKTYTKNNRLLSTDSSAYSYTDHSTYSYLNPDYTTLDKEDRLGSMIALPRGTVRKIFDNNVTNGVENQKKMIYATEMGNSRDFTSNKRMVWRIFERQIELGDAEDPTKPGVLVSRYTQYHYSGQINNGQYGIGSVTRFGTNGMLLAVAFLRLKNVWENDGESQSLTKYNYTAEVYVSRIADVRLDPNTYQLQWTTFTYDLGWTRSRQQTQLGKCSINSIQICDIDNDQQCDDITLEYTRNIGEEDSPDITATLPFANITGDATHPTLCNSTPIQAMINPVTDERSKGYGAGSINDNTITIWHGEQVQLWGLPGYGYDLVLSTIVGATQFTPEDYDGVANQVLEKRPDNKSLVTVTDPVCFYTESSPLLAKNILTPVAQAVAYQVPNATTIPINPADNKTKVVSASAIRWDGIPPIEENGTHRIKPIATYKWKSAMTATGLPVQQFESFVFTQGATNPNWVPVDTISKYDTYSQPVESAKLNSSGSLTFSAAVNGTSRMLPVGAIANAKFAEASVFTCT